MTRRFRPEDKTMAEYGRAMMHEQVKKLAKKNELLSDDDFMKYLRNNSMYKQGLYKAEDKKALSERERKVGRPRPKYCELHEALYLNPRTNNLPVADHCHTTGKYRGWICGACNTGVVPVVDFLRASGIDSEDIKTFLCLAVDYVFTDGKVLEKRL